MISECMTSTHKRTKTLGDIIPSLVTNSPSRGRSTNLSLKMMGMDWVFLEETQKSLNMKYKIIKSKPSLQLPSSSKNSNNKYMNAKQNPTHNNNSNNNNNNNNNSNTTQTDIRSSRSTFNATNKSRYIFNEGLSTGCITTPCPNLQSSYTRKNSVLGQLSQSTATAGATGIIFTNIDDYSRELRKRQRTDPCKMYQNQFKDNQDANEQEELDQIWNNIIESPTAGTGNPIIEERVNSIFQQIKDEDEMKEKEEILLQKYASQMEKRNQNEILNQSLHPLENQEYNIIQKIIKKDKSFKQVYSNKYKHYQNCYNLNLHSQEAFNQDLNGNQKFYSKIEESHIPLQAIYSNNVDLEKDLKQIYLKYEKDAIQVKIPSSKVVKSLVEKRCRRKSTNNSFQKVGSRYSEDDQKYQEIKENDNQIAQLYEDFINQKINQGYPVSKQLKINLNQQPTQNSNQDFNSNQVVENSQAHQSLHSSTFQTPQNIKNYSKLSELKTNSQRKQQDTRSKSTVDQRNKNTSQNSNNTINQIKLPNLHQNKINKILLNSHQIESNIPNIQSKHIKSKLYDSYSIKPEQRFQLYQLKMENINLTKEMQTNFQEQQMIFTQK